MLYFTIEAGGCETSGDYSRKRLITVRALAARDGWHCRYCRILLFPSDELQRHLIPAPPFQDYWGRWIQSGELPDTIRMATVDHVVPSSMGGGNGMDNLVLACAKCNASKGDDE